MSTVSMDSNITSLSSHLFNFLNVCAFDHTLTGINNGTLSLKTFIIFKVIYINEDNEHDNGTIIFSSPFNLLVPNVPNKHLCC